MKSYLKSGEVKCPTCGSVLEEHDCVDIEVDVSRVRLFKVGACLHCGNHYQWYDEFAYEGYTVPEEVEGEYDEPDVDECGFDPYEGCYTYDC